MKFMTNLTKRNLCRPKTLEKREKADQSPCERKNFRGKWAKTVGTDELDKNLTKRGREKKEKAFFV